MSVKPPIKILMYRIKKHLLDNGVEPGVLNEALVRDALREAGFHAAGGDRIHRDQPKAKRHRPGAAPPSRPETPLAPDPRRCHDCGARPGQEHAAGCDVERCAYCGMQALSCDCSAAQVKSLPRQKWTGEWPGEADCRDFGWFSKWDPTRPGWVTCEATDPDASPDLNRLVTEATWNRTLGRFVKK
jgi:hypothetical protein